MHNSFSSIRDIIMVYVKINSENIIYFLKQCDSFTEKFKLLLYNL